MKHKIIIYYESEGEELEMEDDRVIESIRVEDTNKDGEIVMSVLMLVAARISLMAQKSDRYKTIDVLNGMAGNIMHYGKEFGEDIIENIKWKTISED